MMLQISGLVGCEIAPWKKNLRGDASQSYSRAVFATLITKHDDIKIKWM